MPVGEETTASAALRTTGTWQTEDDGGIYAAERAGSLTWRLIVPSSGADALALRLGQHEFFSRSSTFDVSLFVDGIFVCRQVVSAPYGDWQLPEGIAPGGTENDPFFINAIPKDKFVGITGGTTQFNHSCQEHKHSDNPPVTEPDETIAPPPETGDEPETEEPLAGEETGYTPPPEGE